MSPAQATGTPAPPAQAQTTEARMSPAQATGTPATPARAGRPGLASRGVLGAGSMIRRMKTPRTSRTSPATRHVDRRTTKTFPSLRDPHQPGRTCYFPVAFQAPVVLLNVPAWPKTTWSEARPAAEVPQITRNPLVAGNPPAARSQPTEQPPLAARNQPTPGAHPEIGARPGRSLVRD